VHTINRFENTGGSAVTRW